MSNLISDRSLNSVSFNMNTLIRSVSYEQFSHQLNFRSVHDINSLIGDCSLMDDNYLVM